MTCRIKAILVIIFMSVFLAWRKFRDKLMRIIFDAFIVRFLKRLGVIDTSYYTNDGELNIGVHYLHDNITTQNSGIYTIYLCRYIIP